NMAQEVTVSTEQEVLVFLPQIQHTLSGDLANWAAVLTDLAKYLEIYNVVHSGQLPDEMMQLLMDCGMDTHQAVNSMIDATVPILECMFPEGYDHNTLIDRAVELLEQALQLSEAVEGWEFAGIQAHRLGGLLEERGRHAEAEEIMRKAILYAG